MAGLASDGERLEQEVVEQLAVLVALAELGRLGAQLLVAEAGHGGLQLGDPLGLVLERLEAPAFTGVQQLVDDLDHWGTAPEIAEMRSTPIVAQPVVRVARPRARRSRRLPDARPRCGRSGSVLDQFSAGSIRP